MNAGRHLMLHSSSNFLRGSLTELISYFVPSVCLRACFLIKGHGKHHSVISISLETYAEGGAVPALFEI